MANIAHDQDLITAVQSAAKALKVGAKWSSGQSINVADSFLLEMFLLFKIILELQNNYKVDYDPGNAPHKHEFPKNGSPKADRPKFLVKDKASNNVICQICAGTTAEDCDQKPRALDISFQKPFATDSPIADDILQIFDAKYRRNPKRRITSHEFSEFTRWINLFDLDTNFQPPLNLAGLQELNGNCLVTNGQPTTEEISELNRRNVREVWKFHPNTQLEARP